MEVTSASVCEASLHDAQSQIYIENGRTNSDTPLPQNKLSDETLTDLMAAKLKLENEVKKGNLQKKRKRSDSEATAGPSSDTNTSRDQYPVESKTIYLQLKILVKKKVTLAASIKTLEGNLSKNVFPKSVDFKFITNSARDPALKARWTTIIQNCKKDLTKAMIDDLYKKYNQVKDTINTKLIEIEGHLEPAQYNQIKASLNVRAKGMTPVFLKKKELQFTSNPRRKNQGGQKPGPRPKNPRNQNAPRPQFRRDNQKNNLKTLINSLQLLLN